MTERQKEAMRKIVLALDYVLSQMETGRSGAPDVIAHHREMLTNAADLLEIYARIPVIAELPTTRSLTRSDPDFTGTLSTDSFIREVRGA